MGMFANLISAKEPFSLRYGFSWKPRGGLRRRRRSAPLPGAIHCDFVVELTGPGERGTMPKCRHGQIDFQTLGHGNALLLRSSWVGISRGPSGSEVASDGGV